ncbi:MAG TPA: response regulator [Candidatus Dormibacteraeota bacterium]|nr:response regulator [Candidatus Dormibacteraeota bacterium]
MKNSLTGAQVLFVDDEESIRLTLPRILQSQGCVVTAASTFAEAVLHIHKSPFDVLLTDMNIEGEGDGLLVLAEMRRLQPRCLAFVLTGYPKYETTLGLLEPPLHAYFFKPVEIDELIGSVNESLANRNPGQTSSIAP